MKKFSPFLFLFVFLFSSNVFGMEEVGVPNPHPYPPTFSWSKYPNVEAFFEEFNGKTVDEGKIFDSAAFSWSKYPNVEDVFEEGKMDWCKDIIPGILAGRVDPNIVDTDGRTALHFLCSGDLFDPYVTYLIKELLKKEVNLNIQDKDGNTSLMCLVCNACGLERINAVCKEKGVGGIEELHSIQETYYLLFEDLINLLIEKGLTCTAQNAKGENVLHGVIRMLNEEGLQYLLEKLNPNDLLSLLMCKNYENKTPFDLAEYLSLKTLGKTGLEGFSAVFVKMSDLLKLKEGEVFSLVFSDAMASLNL